MSLSDSSSSTFSLPPGSDPSTPLLSVKDLVTRVATPSGAKTVVDHLTFDLARGEILCIAGESGSGKSMTALSLMRLLPQPMARVTGGRALFKGRDILALPERGMRGVRGGDIGMIFQEPMTSLNPVLTIGRQISEAVAAHRSISPADARAEALRLLEVVRIPSAAKRLTQYPHELSGGMRQRVMIAIALSQNPDILIADEPTTALDVTVQARILSLIRHVREEYGTSVILITHDMGVVAEMADTVMVMRHGRVVERADVRTIFDQPNAAYTRELLDALPRLGEMKGRDRPKRAVDTPAGVSSSMPNPTVLDVRDLTVRFDIKGGLLRRPVSRVHAVEGVSFSLRRGETLALVGESGCGKSTTGKALMNLVPWTGSVRLNGHETQGLMRRTLKPLLRDIQLIFQDPSASMDPRFRVGDLVGEPLVIHGLAKGSALTDRVAYLFERVGLRHDDMRRYPHEFSGGQRQRICIARALSLSPKVIIADESVSALDVSIQAQVLDLLQDLQTEMGVAYLFISHDMAVVEQISHRVAVMYMGRLVEMGTRRQIFEDPRHVYTKSLLDAVPIVDPRRSRKAHDDSPGELPTVVRSLTYQGPEQVFTEVQPHHWVADGMLP